MAPSGTHLRRLAAAVVVGLCIWAATPQASWLDDAYITLHSARVVLDGVDSRYHVSALTGATSPPHVAMYAVLLACGASDALAMRLMMSLGLMAYVAALWLLSGATGLVTWPRRAVFLLIGMTAGPILLVATNGLETGFAIAAVISAIAWGLKGQSTAVAAMVGLMPWIRPDLSLIAGGLWLWQLRAAPAAWRRLVLIPVAVGVPFALWLWVDTGSVMPSSIHAKRMFFAESALPLRVKWLFFSEGVGGWWLAALPASAGLALAWRSSIGRIALAAAALTLAGYFWQFPGAVGHNWYRYTYAILLPLAVYGAATAIALLNRPHQLVLVALTAAISIPAQLDGFRDSRGARELREVSLWVEQHVPAGSTVLVHDAGAISTRGRQRLVDLVGLKTPSSIDAHAKWTWPSRGRQRLRAIGAIMRTTHPDYLVITTDWDAIFKITDAAPLAHYRLEEVRHPPGWPLQEPGYMVYRVHDLEPE